MWGNKLELINSSYKKAIAKLLQRKFPDQPPTVTDVLIDPTMKTGRVWLRADQATLSAVLKKRAELQAELPKLIKTRYLPHLEFIADDNYLDRLDELFDKVSQ